MTSKQELLAECLRCPSLQGREIRHALSQVGAETLDDKQLTPGGRPLGCCRVRTLGDVSREQAVPANGAPFARR
jgi:hypothetical protein